MNKTKAVPAADNIPVVNPSSSSLFVKNKNKQFYIYIYIGRNETNIKQKSSR